MADYNEARIHAQKLWNSKACGELEGKSETIEYFLAVEKDRYFQQDWMHDYFEFNKFNGLKVLEIGVGQGTDLIQFAQGGAECYGVDITENHLSLTQSNFSLRGKKVDLRKADATQIPFPDNFFDCIYSFGVMHHIPDIEKVIVEAHRVLKPNGRLMIALYNKWSAFHFTHKLLLSGICKGGFLFKGYKGILAEIEGGADGVNIKPYVKLYGKSDVQKLMRRFMVEDISVHQLKEDHFWPYVLAPVVRPFIPRWESKLGWYVACKARKASQ